ncbi:MAG: Glu-tRNA(Gln) amidotransferase subunit GatE [Candidatus Zixiibacteriota bacterium]|nr:MAG: Glu-tRNA(Gln) amidotransferase subunit GatE [candidate division Zixibacteria bacterium]
MNQPVDPAANHRSTRERVGYIEFEKARPEDYKAIGFKCGLEIHQQLLTRKKLFCRCPAGIYQKEGQYDAELIRHMRPTLSELGEYDGTALMEFRTRKNIIYRIHNTTACTYDIDDTPPFPLDREALDISIQIALLSKLNIVGELHITRKQYLDGSIPTGFQRTAIVGIEGEIPLKGKKVRLIQLSVEEDACREVSDVGHFRTYTTDRLGMPLIETVTYPDMETPQEAAEAAHYLRFLARSTGKVRVGSGAAREDVNVSVSGGQRVEIKGVSHIAWIPRLVHNEAYRQLALLEIRKDLNERIKNPAKWRTKHREVDRDLFDPAYPLLQKARADKLKLVAVNLPRFGGLMSFFTQPGKCFADEISGRLKVIACLERPNMVHSEQQGLPDSFASAWAGLRKSFKASDEDAQVVFWTSDYDLKIAVETIEERCRLAFDGVLNETRKSLPDGTSVFERVLPGPDRMYPDTDSAPIPIDEALIEKNRKLLPAEVHTQLKQLLEWGVPEDTFTYILRNNLMPTLRRVVDECGYDPVFVATTFGHTLKNISGKAAASDGFTYNKVYGLFKWVKDHGLRQEIIREMLPVVYEHPNILFDSVLSSIDYRKNSKEKILAYIPTLKEKFRGRKASTKPDACSRWIMGHLRKYALGNMPLRELRTLVDKELTDG